MTLPVTSRRSRRLLASMIVAGLLGPAPLVFSASAAAAAPPPGDGGGPDRRVLQYADPGVSGTTRDLAGDLVVVPAPDPGPEARAGQPEAGDRYYLKPAAGGEWVELHFDKGLPSEAQGRIDAQVAADGKVRQAKVAAPVRKAPTPSAHRAWIVKITNRGDYTYDGKPATDDDIKNVVDDGLKRWVAESNGYITSFDVQGKVLEAEASGTECYGGGKLWSQVEDELFPDVKFGGSTGNHLFVVQPGGCGGGLGTVGSPSIGNGGYVSFDYSPNKNTTTIPHELGHNFGLSHAHTYTCVGDSCSDASYGNLYTAMGTSLVTSPPIHPGSFDSFDRGKLDIASTCEVQPLELSEGQRSVTRTYDLFGRGSDTGTRGVKVVDPTDGTTYHFDWRNAQGRDAQSQYARNKNNTRHRYNLGVTVQRVVDSDYTQLLTDAPDSDSIRYGRREGQTWSKGGVTLKVDRTGTEQSETASAQITVTLTNPAAADGPALPVQPDGRAEVIGKPGTGETLGVQTDGWAEGTCHRFQWLADGQEVPGALAPTFTVPAELAGKAITVRVTGQRTGYAPTTVTATTPSGTPQWPAADFVPGIAYRFTDAASKLTAAAPAPGSASADLVQRQTAGDETRFAVLPAGEGTYQLKNAATGRCADVAYGSTSEGGRVIDYACSAGSENQLWKVQRHPLGGIALRNVLSDMCLVPKDGSTADGAALVQTRCRLDRAQSWDMVQTVPASEDWPTVGNWIGTVPYEIRNAGSGLDAAIPAGTKPPQYLEQHASDPQSRWKIVANAGGYELRDPANEEICVQQSGTRIGEWYCGDNVPARTWRLAQNPAGGISLINQATRDCLTVKDDSNDSGTQLAGGPCGVEAHDRWEVTASVPPVDQWKAEPAPLGTVPYTLGNLAAGKPAGTPAGARDADSPLVLGATGKAAQFRLEPNPDGTVRIRTTEVDGCMDLYRGRSGDNAEIGSYGCQDSDNQKWRLLANPAGGTSVRSVDSGKCLTTKDGATTDGTTLAQTTCGLDPVQRWDVRVDVPGIDQWQQVDFDPARSYTLSDLAAGKFAGTPAGADSTDSPLVLGATGKAAQFRLEPNPDGTVRIRATEVGGCMDLYRGSTSDNAQVGSYYCGDGGNQKWRVLVNPAGGTSIRSASSGKCLTTKDGAATDGTLLAQSSCGLDGVQRWKLDEAEPVVPEAAHRPTA
ncbi:RICIN domain-containing protein [Kitasatospora cineracea]|uniref:Ricin-type beta-trefoil lectin protein n=1 Tax=Kitasatospora cineracea TaxID=88074 RepID=A0A8G1URH2_9ACTN|nr:RICIN domain-containing protein [Kitasatospora cineracea]ROR46397.1 ricin-type beta-trefoil lectin protein [Kitasatospora cineracea]